MNIYSLDLLDCLILFAKTILFQARTEFQVLEIFEDAGQVQHSCGMLPWKTTIFGRSIIYELARGCQRILCILCTYTHTCIYVCIYMYIYIYIYIYISMNNMHGLTCAFQWPKGFSPFFNGGYILKRNMYEKT